MARAPSLGVAGPKAAHGSGARPGRPTPLRALALRRRDSRPAGMPDGVPGARGQSERDEQYPDDHSRPWGRAPARRRAWANRESGRSRNLGHGGGVPSCRCVSHRGLIRHWGAVTSPRGEPYWTDMAHNGFRDGRARGPPSLGTTGHNPPPRTSNSSAPAPAETPRNSANRRLSENGRCPARTGDLLLVSTAPHGPISGGFRVLMRFFDSPVILVGVDLGRFRPVWAKKTRPCPLKAASFGAALGIRVRRTAGTASRAKQHSSPGEKRHP
jgi:hypothetical protein